VPHFTVPFPFMMYVAYPVCLCASSWLVDTSVLCHLCVAVIVATMVSEQEENVILNLGRLDYRMEWK